MALLKKPNQDQIGIPINVTQHHPNKYQNTVAFKPANIKPYSLVCSVNDAVWLRILAHRMLSQKCTWQLRPILLAIHKLAGSKLALWGAKLYGHGKSLLGDRDIGCGGGCGVKLPMRTCLTTLSLKPTVKVEEI
jgi:hypothetical protein